MADNIIDVQKLMQDYPKASATTANIAAPTVSEAAAPVKETTKAAPAEVGISPATTDLLLQLLLREQGEKAEEKAQARQLKERAKAEMRSMVQAQRQQISANQARCSHTMPRGENAISGQVHNDGKFHPICVVCLKEFPPRSPRGQEIETAVQV